MRTKNPDGFSATGWQRSQRSWLPPPMPGPLHGWRARGRCPSVARGRMVRHLAEDQHTDRVFLGWPHGPAKGCRHSLVVLVQDLGCGCVYSLCGQCLRAQLLMLQPAPSHLQGPHLAGTCATVWSPATPGLPLLLWPLHPVDLGRRQLGGKVGAHTQDPSGSGLRCQTLGTIIAALATAAL